MGNIRKHSVRKASISQPLSRQFPALKVRDFIFLGVGSPIITLISYIICSICKNSVECNVRLSFQICTSTWRFPNWLSFIWANCTPIPCAYFWAGAARTKTYPTERTWYSHTRKQVIHCDKLTLLSALSLSVADITVLALQTEFHTIRPKAHGLLSITTNPNPRTVLLAPESSILSKGYVVPQMHRNKPNRRLSHNRRTGVCS